MLGKIRSYFADGNTAKGYYSFHRSNIDGMNRLLLLKGASGTGKSTLMKKIGMEWFLKGYDIEFMHCSSDSNSINGLIIPKLKYGIVESSPLFGGVNNDKDLNEELLAVSEKEVLDLGLALDSGKLVKNIEDIVSIDIKKQEMFEAAYGSFADALTIHDEWEKIYIENMDFDKASQMTIELEEKFFNGIIANKKAVVRERFLGAATPTGPVDYINNLTEDIAKRYFIKGRPGSGKSTMLKNLAKCAQNCGLDVEIYHCGFDPNSLDMVIVRELGIAIFDSTAPHEYFKSRENDEIVDMYEGAINPGTDEKYATELEDIVNRYSDKIKQGTAFLMEAYKLNNELEKLNSNAMDFDKIDKVRERINSQIEEMEENPML